MKITHADPKPDFGGHVLPLHLESLVPLEILRFEQDGGPSDSDWRRAIEFGSVLACHGDHLLYGGRETPRMAVQIVQAVAVLSFCPGGVKLFGVRYEGEVKEP